MDYSTSDLCDRYKETLQVASPIFQDYGHKKSFFGQAYTLKVFEDNSLVRSTLENPGKNRVLVIDGGGSLRCALLGDMLASLAKKNAWAGIIIFGCIRDVSAISNIAIGIKALYTNPRKSIKRGKGEMNIPVTFADVTIHPGDYIYADEDGFVVSAKPCVI